MIANTFEMTVPDRNVTSFAAGSQRLHDFVDQNPFVEFHPWDVVNDTREIRRIERMTAINSAIEVNLTGQVVADSIGPRIYSNIGGQMDFTRGPNLARSVVTIRGHVQCAVAEFGPSISPAEPCGYARHCSGPTPTWTPSPT